MAEVVSADSIDWAKLSMDFDRRAGKIITRYITDTFPVHYEDKEGLGIARFDELEAKLYEKHMGVNCRVEGYEPNERAYLLDGYKGYMHINAVAELWDGSYLRNNGMVTYLECDGPPSELEGLKQVYWNLLKRLDWISSGVDLWVHNARLTHIIKTYRQNEIVREIEKERNKGKKLKRGMVVKPISATIKNAP